MSRPAFVLGLVLGLLVAGLPLTAQSKKKKNPEWTKTKRFHSLCYVKHPDQKSWRDMQKAGIGIKDKGEDEGNGVIIFTHRQFFETPGGQSRPIGINGLGVKPTNTSKLVKEFQKMLAGGFKKVHKQTKPKKFACKLGKGIYCDLIASKPDSEDARNWMNGFTAWGASVDATRRFDPNAIKMHLRLIAIKSKEGVHFMSMMATEGIMKKQRKTVDKLLKGLTSE